MIDVIGDVGGRLLLENNVLACGADRPAGNPCLPLAFEAGWRDGYQSRGNALPPPPPVGWPDAAAVVQVGSQNDAKSYPQGPAAWLALPGVGGDKFAAVPVETAADAHRRILTAAGILEVKP